MKRICTLLAVIFGLLPCRLPAADPAPFKAVVIGSGAPMILIPGLASGGNVWDGAVAHFKGQYQCHVLTLAGFAGQPAIDGPFLEKVRDGVVKYIHDQKLQRPVIIGHSLGGMMAYWVAEAAPADVGPIIVLDGLPFFSAMMDPDATEDSVKPMGEQMKSMYAGLGAEQYVQNNHQFLAAMITDKTNVDKVAALGDKSNPKAVGQAFYDLVTHDLRPKLNLIQSPLLLIGSDLTAPDDNARASIHKAYADQIAAVPRHKLVFAPKAKHFIQLDEPEFFYSQADAFLKENKR